VKQVFAYYFSCGIIRRGVTGNVCRRNKII